MTDTNKEPVILHEMKVKGNQLVDKVKEVIEDGNARSVAIKKDGKTVLSFPLSVGVGGAAAALFWSPTLAAVGAFAALVTDVSIVVERVEKPSSPLDIHPTTPPPTPGVFNRPEDSF